MNIGEAIWYKYNDLGKSALANRQYDLAEIMFVAAVEEAQRTPRNFICLADSLYNLAQTYHYQNKFRQASACYRRTIAIYERKPDQFAYQLGAALANLAIIYIAAKGYGRARTLLRRAIMLYENLLGVDHYLLAPLLVRLGYIYSEWKEYDTALKLQARARMINEKGPQSPKRGSVPVPV